MRAIIQRVTEGRVKVGGELIGEISKGLVVLLGVSMLDTEKDAAYLADKIANLRIFSDSEGKMNLSIKEVKGQVLAVSQFTLYGDCRKGRRPSFAKAAAPEKAKELYEKFILKVEAQSVTVEKGLFQAEMLVQINNDGPVTFILDSKGNF